ncbi:MAG: peroxiredoxin [Rhodospirillales bacterium RIFCSPLOWO2_12_FULL_58_28]|nr:MAG: peroxiredoxin [Rhodospirillales bacterium RIFCSPLOWO2_02_FULL_58_16]OHC77697.1 MAG: peroxiredoxin [Rhodospirillales bacterium RIFCSPLOWO2_12_FULL_58_28]
MKVRIKWVQDRTFLGESGSGHSVVMDGAPEAGGRNLGVRPMEMVLLGLGGCTCFDVIDILQKSRQPVKDCVVEIDSERSESHPRVFTRIHVHFIVSGRGLSPDKVERAVNLSAEKYCSVSMMLNKTAEITHDFEVIEPEKDQA